MHHARLTPTPDKTWCVCKFRSLGMSTDQNWLSGIELGVATAPQENIHIRRHHRPFWKLVLKICFRWYLCMRSFTFWATTTRKAMPPAPCIFVRKILFWPTVLVPCACNPQDPQDYQSKWPAQSAEPSDVWHGSQSWAPHSAMSFGSCSIASIGLQEVGAGEATAGLSGVLPSTGVHTFHSKLKWILSTILPLGHITTCIYELF